MKRYLLPLLALGQVAVADTGLPDDDWYSMDLESLLQVRTPPKAQVGSRHGLRSVKNTAVPVDVYTAEQLLATGEIELARALAALVPGFNYPRPSIADGTDHAPPFTLRTLQPDQVLVLVNGKRLHQGSLLHTNGTIGRGSSGTDLNTIALLAVERVEILRDGAAAQYGSDAIAGIVNIILKGYGQAHQGLYQWGRTHEGDGLARHTEVMAALPLAGDGFANLVLSRRDRGSSNRANAGVLDNGRVRQHFGDAQALDDSLAFNAELPRADTLFYAHGHYNRRKGSAGAFYRYADDDRNVTDLYPDGFLPLIEPRIRDYSATLGVKGVLDNGASWDLSYTRGENDYHFYVRNSLNRSLGTSSPRSFDSGSTRLTQDTLNLDINQRFGAHSLSAGYEMRRERYRIRAGDPASYLLGPEAAWYPGAQGFGGFSPDNAVSASRLSQALYVDFKYVPVAGLTLGTAVRAEHFSDFGSTVNGKLSLHYQPVEQWQFRSSLSSGFRAPSLSQANFTSTAMVREGTEILQYGTYGVDHPVARALGARKLKAEKSAHFTLGTVWQPTEKLNLSADWFVTDIRDRIMATSYIAGWSLAELSPGAQAILNQHGVDGAVYFTNAVGTRTQGYDLRLDYQDDLANGHQWQVQAAFQQAKTRINRVNRAPDILGVDMNDLVLDHFTRVTLEQGQPQHAFSLWGQYKTPAFALSLGLRRHGSYASTYGDQTVRFAAPWVLDPQISFNLGRQATLAVGATNLLNSRPQQWGVTDADDPLHGKGKPIAYSQYAPYGYNGRTWYLRLGARF
ncbi:MAG: TonB-dependent receptor [Gammaproteobacteria bacterium]|nr:TonB-dependent receptor [Gammaproteobacteria bacterium]